MSDTAMLPVLIDSGIVYRNPKPYLRAIHAWHPSLVALPGGELLASFDLAQAVESMDYRTWLSRSADGGRTWSAPTRLCEDPVQPATHTLRLSLLSQNRVVAMGTRFHRADSEEGLVNRSNHGFVPMDVILTESRDGGRAWTAPRVIVPPCEGPGFEVCHPVVELADGRWLWPTSTLAGWDGEAPGGIRCVAFVSHDGGRTWPDTIEIFADPAGKVTYWEVSLLQLGDGRLVSTIWAVDRATGAALPSLFSMSRDGKNFLSPQPTGFLAQTAKIHALGGNRLLCAYRRDDRPGLWARFVTLDGEEWINGGEIPLWQGAASGMTGRQITDELSALRFGYPTMVSLSPHEVLLAFWYAADGDSGIRWIRIGV